MSQCHTTVNHYNAVWANVIGIARSRSMHGIEAMQTEALLFALNALEDCFSKMALAAKTQSQRLNRQDAVESLQQQSMLDFNLYPANDSCKCLIEVEGKGIFLL